MIRNDWLTLRAKSADAAGAGALVLDCGAHALKLARAAAPQPTSVPNAAVRCRYAARSGRTMKKNSSE